MIPTPVTDDGLNGIPPLVMPVLEQTNYFIVENIKTARRFIRSVVKTKNIDACVFEELDKHADYLFDENFLQHAVQGHDIGLLSEAGMPCLADPGHKVVMLAHDLGIRVIPLPGPSAMILALTASGFNGQQFSFNGYLPIDPKERKAKLQQMETLARKGVTQLFMDTPYRNQKLFDEILQCCPASAMLCIACDLTAKSEYIRTMSLGEWKKQKPDLHKRPAVFLFGQ